jgi:hypothetical protein
MEHRIGMKVWTRVGATLLALSGFVVWSQEASTKLPDGPGKELTARLCGQCHGIEKFASDRRTKADWDEIINKMADDEGLEITQPEYEVVIAYLSKYLGPEKK